MRCSEAQVRDSERAPGELKYYNRHQQLRDGHQYPFGLQFCNSGPSWYLTLEPHTFTEVYRVLQRSSAATAGKQQQPSHGPGCRWDSHSSPFTNPETGEQGARTLMSAPWSPNHLKQYCNRKQSFPKLSMPWA